MNQHRFPKDGFGHGFFSSLWFPQGANGGQSWVMLEKREREGMGELLEESLGSAHAPSFTVQLFFGVIRTASFVRRPHDPLESTDAVGLFTILH